MYLIQNYFHLQYFVCVFIALFLDLPTITMHNYIYKTGIWLALRSADLL